MSDLFAIRLRVFAMICVECVRSNRIGGQFSGLYVSFQGALTMNVEEIAQQAGGEVTGDSQLQITGVAGFEVAGPTLSHLRIVRPLLRRLRPHSEYVSVLAGAALPGLVVRTPRVAPISAMSDARDRTAAVHVCVPGRKDYADAVGSRSGRRRAGPGAGA